MNCEESRFFNYLDEDFQPIVGNSSTTSSPSFSPFPYKRMPSMGTPFGLTVGNKVVESGPPEVSKNRLSFVSFKSPSTSEPTSLGTTFMSAKNESDFESKDNKIEFKIIVEYLENLRQNNQTFQTNILKELKQMREVMADLQKSIQEMPIRFADALSQCLESVNGRSDSLSVDSEPEIVDIFDKIDVTNDCKEEEDNSFVDFCNNSSKECEIESLEENKGSIVDKFVFEYNPSLDLDKWLKKD